MGHGLVRTDRAGHRHVFEAGDFNFWTTDRLLRLEMINAKQARLLERGTRFYLKDHGYFEFLLHDRNSGYNLYLSDLPPPAPVVAPESIDGPGQTDRPIGVSAVQLPL